MGFVVKKTTLNSSKDDFLMKSFPFSTKRKLSILLNFLFPFFIFQRCIFNLEMQNSCLKTSAGWSRSIHFVENGYPLLRFPNMVKMNIHQHWTRVTRFNPLWVSGCVQSGCNYWMKRAEPRLVLRQYIMIHEAQSLL